MSGDPLSLYAVFRVERYRLPPCLLPEGLRFQKAAEAAFAAGDDLSGRTWLARLHDLPYGLLDAVEGRNLVVTQGANALLESAFRNTSYGHFMGLKLAGAVASADTLAAKAWSEATGYSEATRPAVLYGAASGRVIANLASKAVFTMNASLSIAGLFTANVSSKGTTGGTLFNAVDYAAARAVQNLDVLRSTVTFTV